ncbi:serine/threonine-protein kinase [Sorangium sp. So ce1078]|uniref:serine/threonine-protein kinase n=1 Tax=Sorangium sp. So ce1078 TaxID=3133329 RepID=UPI003F645AD1
MSGSMFIAGGQASSAARERALTLIGRTLLHRYRIEELVAMGGIAAVFRATKLATGEDVAVKLLHPDAEELPELIERFEREAIAGRHIFHPNVAAVYEINQLDDGAWFMVMEFIRGITLRKLIDKGPIPPPRAANIARQIATALNAAHDFGIVHRDVKPLNIMVLDGPEERVQLIDFGLAKVPVEQFSFTDEGSRRSLTNAGVLLGTVAYMAPEAALGMRSVDRRADLYALGVILYEMLAGKHPFTAVEPSALFAQHRSTEPPPIAERSPGIVVPPALEAVVMRLLAKDPDHRFPHARAVLVALDAAIQKMGAPDGSLAIAAPTSLRAAASFIERRTSRAVLAGAGLLFFALGSVIAWLLVSR